MNKHIMDFEGLEGELMMKVFYFILYLLIFLGELYI